MSGNKDFVDEECKQHCTGKVDQPCRMVYLDIMKTEVVVFGAATIEFICKVPSFPRSGETVIGEGFSTDFGGRGANQCIQAARLGVRTAMMAKLGDDEHSRNYLRRFREESINVDFVKQVSHMSTGISMVNVTDGDEKQTVIVGAANDRLNNEDVKNAQELFNSAKVLVCQMDVPLTATLNAMRAFKGVTILNAAPALENTPRDLLIVPTVVCISSKEAAIMTGVDDIKTLKQARTALEKILKIGANTIIITLNALGAVFVSKSKPDEYTHVPNPHTSKVVDTNGACDSFIGALAYSMATNPDDEMHKHVGLACYIASRSVQSAGSQASYPRIKDLLTSLDGMNVQQTPF